ncbi:MAG: ABC transporter permease [Halapricum sp.]
MATDAFTHGHRDASSSTSRRVWVGQARSFFGRYVRELGRNKTVLFWSLAFPVVFYLLTIAVFVPTEKIPADVLPVVKASTAISYGTFGAVVACLNSFGQQLAADFEAGRYRQFRALPIHPTADAAGRMAAGLVLSAASFLVVVVVSVLTGAEYAIRSPVSPVVAVLAFLSFAVVWMVVAMVLVSAVNDERYATIITVAVALLSYMLTGYNGADPGSYTGPSVLLNYLPNTLPTRLLVYHLTAVPASDLTQPAIPGTVWGLATLAVYTVLALAVCVVLVRAVVYGQEVLS